MRIETGRSNTEQKPNKQQLKSRKDKHSTSGIAIGLAIGVAIGVAINSIGTGMAIGLAIGAGLDIVNKRRRSDS